MGRTIFSGKNTDEEDQADEEDDEEENEMMLQNLKIFERYKILEI